MNTFLINFIDNNVFILLPYLVLAFAISCILVALSYLIVTQNIDLEKNSGYECGFDPFSDARDPFYIQFYIISLLFIIFDIEVVFFLPFIITIEYTNIYTYYVFMIFVVLLVQSLYYEWYKKCLEF
jgi:NADH:ubiquinone oxidoreductase subunit 3 (subunit A)